MGLSKYSGLILNLITIALMLKVLIVYKRGKYEK